MQEVQRNERGYAYLEFCAGSHDHIHTRIWLHNSLIQEDKTINFPVMGAWIFTTEKGSLVMRPREGGVVYHATISSGYRGSAKIKTCSSPDGECEVVATGQEYHSGQGALGETSWALVNSDGPIEVYGYRSGRRIDENNVAFRLTPDGEQEELVQDTQVCEILEG